jgi:hypothetical protein
MFAIQALWVAAASAGRCKEPDFETAVPAGDDEDEARFAAIDEGIRDAREGRVSMAQVRKLLPKRITNSSSRKDR